MTYFLRPDVSLSQGEQGAVLTRDGSGVSHPLTAAETAALTLLSHYGDPDTVRRYMNAAMPMPVGHDIVDHVLDRWTTYLGQASPRPLDTDKLNTLVRHAVTAKPEREAAPAALTWLVTLTCNRHCPYCYYDVLPWNADSTSLSDACFPLNNMLNLLDEMARIGTADLYLTGGEPLLREDLPQIIARASGLGIRTHVNTKFGVNKALARSLADAGVGEVSFSLDASQQRIADGLAGCHGFFREAVAAIDNMLAAGINLQINAVVTGANADDLVSLLAFCREHGVRKVTFSPFMEPSLFRGGTANLKPRSTFSITGILPGLQSQFSDMALQAGSAEPMVNGDPIVCNEKLLCEVGIRTLDILPDGRVTRCRYAPNDERFVVGDLKEQSLMAVWNGSALRRLTFPDSKAMTGTACAGCTGRQSCNSRGRCLLGSVKQHGSMFGPDAACER